MANMQNFVYLTSTQYDTLLREGEITVGGVTHIYDPNSNVYMVSGEQMSAIPSSGMLANVFYNLGEITTDPNVTLAASANPQADDEWMLAFSIGATAPASITFPSNVKFSSTPSFGTNKCYEISIKWYSADNVYRGIIQNWNRE